MDPLAEVTDEAPQLQVDAISELFAPFHVVQVDDERIARAEHTDWNSSRKPAQESGLMTTPAPRNQVGPYEILVPIGEGGMGKVYKARDTRLDRIVALKVCKSEYSERFEREARAVAALNHPNICTLFDVGPNYLVMEYVEGTPLMGPSSVEAVMPYALQICDALAAAHEKGITHRDLKPANILLTKSGIKLLDFGLAKIKIVSECDKTASHTQTGNILGTPPYMSPEQVQGQPVDARSDIFSFGSLLYEWLTGRRAFQGSSVLSILTSILRDEPAPLESAPEVQRVIARCLRKHPADRYQSAADLRAALEDISLRNPAVSAALDSLVLKLVAKYPDGPPSSAAQVQPDLQAVADDSEWTAAESARFKHSNSRPSSAIWGWGALVFMLLAGVVAWWYAVRNVGLKDPAINQITATLSENRVTAAAVSPDGSRVAYSEFGGSLIIQEPEERWQAASSGAGENSDRNDLVDWVDG